MKQMKTTIAATVALATLAGTQLFAQNTKIDTISLTMSLQSQESVSTSASALNAGNFSQGPLYYKTIKSSFITKNVLQAIAYVLHSHNAGFYSSQATLELVQGEMGGFWNINDYVAQSYPDFDDSTDGNNQGLTGSFNDDGNASSNPYYTIFINDALQSVYFPGVPYGEDTSGVGPYDFSGPSADLAFIPNVVDDNTRISISDGPGDSFGNAGGGAYTRLDTGRHFLPVPWASYDTSADVGTPYPTTGEYPVGHMQPWGQVYVKDPGHKDSSGNPLCENVTFFFDFEVQECYDCFYLNSFISDATFKNVAGPQNGPPCCSSASQLTGVGTDHYYLSLDFDNTVNNSYLNPALKTNDDETTVYAYNYVGFPGLTTIVAPADGLTPDLLAYSDVIKSHLGSPSPYETRFSLHGIVTYSWALKLISPSDVAQDYVGRATYVANGYGFIGLFCDLINTASVTFTEQVVKDVGCCDDETFGWWDDEFNGSFNGQTDYGTYVNGWFGPGWDGGYGYYNPDVDGAQTYPYYNIIAGQSFDTTQSFNDVPYQFESPFNPAAALTRHQVDYGSSGLFNFDPDTYPFSFEE